MGDYKRIENELLRIGPSKLQDIVFQIITKKYTPVNAVNLGSASGTETTRIGTPDGFIQLSNGDYIYVEVTIQKTELMSKIKADIKKCKDKAETLLASDGNVRKVIYACLGKLDSTEIQECQKLCKDFCIEPKTPFEFWGLDKLSIMLTQEYQSIARSELNIKFTYGLVKTLDEYLLCNEFDVSHTHEFLFRENELSEMENKLFLKNVVLLNGPAGCGKTRLCMQLAKKLKHDGTVKEVYYVKDAYYNSFDLLCTEIGTDKTIIILDDVNRLPYIKEFVIYVQTHKNIYVLATVRDYAVKTILDDLKINNLENLLENIEVGALKSEQQDDIIKKIIPGASYDTLNAIHNVAHENLRFAIMMAEVLIKDEYMPTKMAELMEKHFKRVDSDLKEAITNGNNLVYLKALVLLAFFHRIVIDDGSSDWNTISSAMNHFGIDITDFCDAMAYWDRKEVVNMSFDGQVYEIGDQILSAYIFYKLVVEEKQIALKDMFYEFFPKYHKCFVDMFNSILPTYGVKNGIAVQQLEELWNNIYKIKYDNESVQFISTFYKLLPIEALHYIRKKGDGLTEQFIDILCGFESSKHYQVAINILLEYIDNCLSDNNIVKTMTESFSIHRNSYDNDLNSQRYLLSKLSEKLIKNKLCRELFIELSKEFLQPSFHSTEMHGNTITYFTIAAFPCDSLFDLRNIVWNGLFDLYHNGYYKLVSNLLEKFRYLPNSKKLEEIKEILDNDKTIVLPFVQSELENELSFIQKVALKNMLEVCCSDNYDEYKKLVNSLEAGSVDFKIYSNVFSRKRDRIGLGFEHSKYGEIFKKINLEKDFFNYIEALLSLEISNNVISYAVNEYFSYLDKETSELFVSQLKKFIMKFKDLDISYETISNIIALRYNLKEIIGFVQISSLCNKRIVLLELLRNLRTDQISIDLYELGVSMIKEEYCIGNNNSQRLIRLSNYLEYEKFKPGFILQIFEAIQNLVNSNIAKYSLLEDFYIKIGSNQWSYKKLSIEQIESCFGEKVQSVYYEMFFIMIKSNLLHVTNDFIEHISSKNIEYLYRYYDLFFVHDKDFRSTDYLEIDLLKKFPNLAENMLKIYERSKQIVKFYFSEHSIKSIIKQNFNDQTFKEFVELFVKKYSAVVEDLNNMAEFVASLKSSWQIIFVKTLISAKINIEIFNNLKLFRFPSSWSGSDAIICDQIIETIDVFLQGIDITIQNLDYIAIIKERKDQLFKYKSKARLRELGDYRFFA